MRFCLNNASPPSLSLYITHRKRQSHFVIWIQWVLPFWRISRCSQRMSPMKGGVRARKFSLPMAHMSRPRMRKCCSTTPSSENSLMAQLSQRETSLSDHNRGSVPAAQTKQKFQFRKNKTLWLSYFEEHAHNNKRDTHTVAAEIAKVLSCSLRSSSTTESNEQLPLGFLLDDASAVCPPPPLLLLHPPPHINKQVCVGEKGGGSM